MSLWSRVQVPLPAADNMQSQNRCLRGRKKRKSEKANKRLLRNENRCPMERVRNNRVFDGKCAITLGFGEANHAIKAESYRINAQCFKEAQSDSKLPVTR